jgi:hypothetical protein
MVKFLKEIYFIMMAMRRKLLEINKLKRLMLNMILKMETNLMYIYLNLIIN